MDFFPPGYFKVMSLLLAIAAIIIGLIIWRVQATWYSKASATVTGFSWTRTIDVDRVHWDSQSNTTGCPSGSHDCQSYYQKTGQTCYGTGTSKTCTDNYGWEYDYTVPIWHVDHTARAGGDTRTPEWPSFTLDQSDPDRPERVGIRRENYQIIFTSTEKANTTYHWSVPEAQWLKAVLGTGYSLRVHDAEVSSATMN